MLFVKQGEGVVVLEVGAGCAGGARSPSKNTGVGFHFLLQGIFLTQGSDLHLLPWRGGARPGSRVTGGD